MKKKLILFFILLLLFAGGMAGKYFFLNSRGSGGRLKILSSPSANVFLNNTSVGKTPYEDKVKHGEYILKLIPEGVATEAASWQGKITIYKNALTYVDRELGASDLTSAGVVLTTSRMPSKPKNQDTGEVEVETEPNGAIVYLDNDEKGIAPLVLADVRKGEHELAVFSPGFFRRTQKINVERYYRTTGQFKLALDQSQKKIEDLVDEATDSADLEQNEAENDGSASADTDKQYIVVIKNTPTGWLRVRSEPSIIASEEAKVYPEDSFDLLEETDDWYKIAYKKGEEGWISAQYASKKAAND